MQAVCITSRPRKAVREPIQRDSPGQLGSGAVWLVVFARPGPAAQRGLVANTDANVRHVASTSATNFSKVLPSNSPINFSACSKKLLRSLSAWQAATRRPGSRYDKPVRSIGESIRLASRKFGLDQLPVRAQDRMATSQACVSRCPFTSQDPRL
ncbi:hypothetical protein N657DRAFT_645078 [Parathielavia appendiculata]|uniref:Uncharacterized protein n=1 Tax=Parathielavia appendiculata TaxID=2587402 RepID=A0AAN6Z3E1_9PEZI|nr:hypothetical protein N657DRAFT_645078 [Parathielavia appendiculata]